MADTPVKSLDRERAASPSLVLPSKSQRFTQTPPLTPSESSRPTTSMSGTNDSSHEVEGDYERYIMSQTNVVRKGKGYQSEYTIRGKGIEHIPSNSNFNTAPNPKRNSMFNRLATSNNPAPERSNTVQRVANAFKTIVTGGPKKREQGVTATPIVVGGGFNPGVEAPWMKKEAPRSVRTWSRAQAA